MPFIPAQRNPEAIRAATGILWLWLAAAGVCPGALVSNFQAGDSGWQLGTLATAQLDKSPDLEIVVPYRDSTGAWYLDAFKYTGQRLPGFPYYAGGDPINVSPTICDLDHDGLDEIIFTRANHLIVLRADASVFWSNTVSSANYVPTGGYQTVTNGFYWTATGGWIPRLPATAQFFSEVSSPMVLDLNGTGTMEIVTGWKILPDPAGGAQDYNPFIKPIYGFADWGTIGENWSGGVVFHDALTGEQKSVYHMHHLFEAGLAVGHAAADRPLHIYALNDSDSVVAFDKSQPFGLWGKGMLHRQFGKAQRLMCGSYQIPIEVYTADIDGDGLDEALTAGTQLSSLWQPNETILDDDGAVLWRRWLPHIDYTNRCGWLNSSCLIPVNPDHDNHADVLGFNHSYELTFRSWNGIELVDKPGWPKNFYPLLPTPPVVGDVDGDGAEEIILGTYNPTVNPSTGNLLIFALDGTLKISIPVAGGIKQIPTLAAVEGNGRLDVIYRSLAGQVYIQNFGATTANRVSWATHRGNMRRDGNYNVSLYPSGTPLVPQRSVGFRHSTFSWTPCKEAQGYRVFRAEQASGPFAQIASVTAATTNYTDYGLRPGWQYSYEIGAVYGSNVVHSPPFALTPLLNHNLVANSGFEENDNSHWDKWFSGNIPMTNMVASTNLAFQGKQSMRVLLQADSNGTISQFNQYGIPDSTIYVTPGAFYSFGGWFKSTGISRASEHWFEWSSTRTAYDTNNRPGLPWPYYFTPHLTIGTNATDWVYVNRTFQMPAGFPNVELRHSYTLGAGGRGAIYMDNVFFRQVPAPNATNWTSLIPFGATWRYFTNLPPGNWFADDFDDRPWQLGTAKFGGGSGPTNIVTRLPQLRPAYYFRKTFDAGSAQFEELLLSATCTDDSGSALYPIRVFLNGTEINSPIDIVTSEGNLVRHFDLTPFALLLRPGTNTIAVQLSNYWSTWDDVAFDVSLKAVPYQPLLPLLKCGGLSPSGPQFWVNTPPGSIWQLQSCELGAPGQWQPVQTVTNTAGTQQCLQDTGQNGRALPSSVPGRLYRLVPVN